MGSFCSRVHIPAPVKDVFGWHSRPGAFERLTPPWLAIRILKREGGIGDGSRVTIRVPIGALTTDWEIEHCGYEEDRFFRDRMVRGPFSFWEHTHEFIADGPSSTILEDRIDYTLPMGAVGRFVAEKCARNHLAQILAYRHSVTAHDILAHVRHRSKIPQRILLSGANGLVGRSLAVFLTTGGHKVTHLARGSARFVGDSLYWDPSRNELHKAAFEGFDIVVHLAGERILGRWNMEKKRRIRESRVHDTRLLCDTLSKLSHPPRAIVIASAVGFYGDRGDEILTERSASGQGFLSEVAQQWEQAAESAVKSGIRVAYLRSGVILSPAGALAPMFHVFRLGLGGRLGSGRHWMSWIGINDAVGAIYHIMMNDSLVGAFNLVAPEPSTNREFTNILGKALSRPTPFPVPPSVLRAIYGEAANEVLLASVRAEPVRLLQSGYQFRHPHLEDCLRHVLGRELVTNKA